MKKVSLSEFPTSETRYMIKDTLSKGSFGEVFCAVDTNANNKSVAIKIQNLNEDTIAIIEQEYKVLKYLTNYDNFPTFYGIYNNKNNIWFVMELCEGGCARELVSKILIQNRRMSEEHIAYILKEILKAVTFLHEHCTIHRNIKAKNVLLTKDGEVKICEFGLSCALTKPLDKTETCIGSPAWIAPEVVNFNRTKQLYDNRVDVWSLGITAIELGDGKPPYEKMHPSRALFQIVTNPPPKLHTMSQWSENYIDFVNECLVKNPEHRPYMLELFEHPFLSQVPENNYHLSLEIKVLIEEMLNVDIPKEDDEIIIVGNRLKFGLNGYFENMLVEDLASLNKITEEKILDLLKLRFEREQFQTFIGDVLLSLNPNEKKFNFGPEYHKKYSLKSRSDNAPHIYSVADSAYQNALHHNIPQKIILSGESGSGKTTNYLHLIDHLLYLGENKIINLHRLKKAIKLIHSFTHASTAINDYSTRCIFQTELKYGTTGKISGALFTVQQLEKWRISSVDMCHGNFHIFYYIYYGLCENKQMEQYKLSPNQKYRYLRVCDDVNKIDIVPNLSKFKHILKTFEDFELGDEFLDTFLSTISAILNIGEIKISESDIGCAFIENNYFLENAANLLKIEANKLEWALTNYCEIKKGSAIRKRKSPDDARNARDVLANTLYVRLINYVVALINHKLSLGSSIFGEKYSIQIFDYFGFECFKSNLLSQLFVNCFNEQLHFHYLQRLFFWEYLDAIEEELNYQPFNFHDNKQNLDQLLSKSEGLFTIIDEASKGGHNGQYVMDFIQTLAENHVTTATFYEFSVAHYTGRVTYDSREMPDKNRDFLPPEIIETLRLSNNLIIKLLFTNKLDKSGNLIVVFDNDNKLNKQRFKFSSVKESTNQYSQIKKIRTCISTFKATSLQILKKLSVGSGSGGTHFIRCLRSDLKKTRNSFNFQLVKQQIRALAVAETTEKRQEGYPHRIAFQEFLRRYQFLAFDFNENVEVSRENCRLLLIRLKMEGWTIGKSKVFLKYYNEEYLSRLYENQVKKIIKIQSILRKFLAKCRVMKEVKNLQTDFIKKIGIQCKRMTEEEAAALIQKAYRESTLKKSYVDFAKDFKVLDEGTCNFIQPFADKWRRTSLFHILVLYRAVNLQESFNFCQQVHLYNIGAFYELQKINESVYQEKIDSNAMPFSWLNDRPLPVQRVPFRLNDIPFYDASEMCNLLINPGTSIEKDESWDVPYRWRQLVMSKPISEATDLVQNVENFDTCNSSFSPPNDVLVKQETSRVKIVVEEYVSTKDKNNEKGLQPDKQVKSEVEINSIAKPANSDFNYIKNSITQSPKVDPVAELKKLSEKIYSDDEAPFNFRRMLRKTNFQKEPNEIRSETSTGNLHTFQLKKLKQNSLNSEKNGDVMNGCDINEGKRIKVELYPGVFIEGVEINL